MNLFALNYDPRLAAADHADKHVVKMLLEACQLLYTAHWIWAYPGLLEHNYSVKIAEEQKKLSVPESMFTAPTSISRPLEPGFRPAHIHHPCAVWVRQSQGNYLWAAELAIGLADEYTYRYGKIHSCEAHAKWLFENVPDYTALDQEDFVQAMYDEYKRDDAVEGYRAYYRGSKGDRGLLQYTRREKPAWIFMEQS